MARLLLPAQLVLLSALGCSYAEPDESARCARLEQRIDTCLGPEFLPVQCEGMSERDVAVFERTLEELNCDSPGELLPADGDTRAAWCRLFGQGCAVPQSEPPRYQPARYPIVLVNGIDLSPLFRYSDRIVDVLRNDSGQAVYLATLTPYETPQRRAKVLWERIEQIKAESGATKVNLICHSLGGLDCRYLVSPGGLRWEIPVPHEQIVGSVASITTFSTAHRGTRAADAALGYLPDADDAEAVNSLATLFGEWFTRDAIEQDVHLKQSLQALSEQNAPAFNAEIVDAEGIYYQSWAGFSRPFGAPREGHDETLTELCRDSEGNLSLGTFSGQHDFMSLALVPSTNVVGGADLPSAFVPNDGLCTVASARWGRFRGCVPADHSEQLGQRNLPDVNVRTGFDIAWFYASVAAELSAMGY
ncbi:MAG: hypothetical protein R3B13_17105 [Polyangiaceae bacterium]